MRNTIAVWVMGVLMVTGFFVACGGTTPQSQSSMQTSETAPPRPQGVVILVSDTPKIAASYKAIEGLRALTPPVTKMQILVCGQALDAFVPEHEGHDVVRKAIDAGVEFKACRMAIERLGVDASAFDPDVQFVDHAFVEAVRLQQEGWYALMP